MLITVEWTKADADITAAGYPSIDFYVDEVMSPIVDALNYSGLKVKRLPSDAHSDDGVYTFKQRLESLRES